MTKHVNMMSGSKGSWAAGKLVVAKHGTENLIHLFTDTKYEDEDLYRFLPEAVANIGGKLVRLCDGRTPWEVFRDVRLIGNTRAAPCSRELKQKLARQWLDTVCDPAETILYVGILWYERHRMETTAKRIGIRDRWLPYRVEAPLTEPPYLSPYELIAWMEREGLTPPRLYDEGAGAVRAGGCAKTGGCGEEGREGSGGRDPC